MCIFAFIAKITMKGDGMTMEELLTILDKEKGSISRAKIAQMLGKDEQEVAESIETLE